MNLMRDLATAALLTLALLLGTLTPAPAQQIDCRQFAIYDTNTNGATKLITGQTLSDVYICGWQFFAGGTSTVQWVTGTGTNCADTQAALTPAFPLVVNTGVDDPSPFYRGLFVTRARDICIKTNAGVAVQAIIYYVQR